MYKANGEKYTFSFCTILHSILHECIVKFVLASHGTTKNTGQELGLIQYGMHLKNDKMHFFCKMVSTEIMTLFLSFKMKFNHIVYHI